jgi:hypothetical protein
MASGAIALYLLVRPQGDGTVNQAPTRIPIPPEHPAFIILCISVFSASLVNFIALRRTTSVLRERIVPWIPGANPDKAPHEPSS